jgi:molybdopterin-synthase adenylyltransferase
MFVWSAQFIFHITAGLMREQFTRWLRGLPVDADTYLNLLAGEMQVGAVAV